MPRLPWIVRPFCKKVVVAFGGRLREFSVRFQKILCASGQQVRVEAAAFLPPL